MAQLLRRGSRREDPHEPCVPGGSPDGRRVAEGHLHDEEDVGSASGAAPALGAARGGRREARGRVSERQEGRHSARQAGWCARRDRRQRGHCGGGGDIDKTGERVSPAFTLTHILEAQGQQTLPCPHWRKTQLPSPLRRKAGQGKKRKGEEREEGGEGLRGLREGRSTVAERKRGRIPGRKRRPVSPARSDSRS